MVFVTGDLHGNFERFKPKYFPEQARMTKQDIMICAGDFGGVWFGDSRDDETLDWLERLPFTLAFVCGNHENYDALERYPVAEWHGGKVHRVRPHVLHLMRGQIFKIDGLKFFTFGGAYSIDKMSRAEGISWFPEEIPSREEYEEGWKNLEKEDFQVDYILTHTAPRDVAAAMGYGELSDDEVELRQYLQRVADETEFQKWYFGHFHEDAEVEEVFVCLYDEIVELS